MSQVRVHNFSISLDGFGTGEGMTFDAPFGHAGHRLHEWMFATRFGRRSVLGESGGTEGVDHVMADQNARDRCGDHGRGQVRPVRPSTISAPTRVARVVGRQPAVPHADVRPDPQSAPVAGDGGWYDVPLRRRRAADALDVAPAGRRYRTSASAGARRSSATFIAAGLVDHLHVVQVPILLGRGVRLWDGLGGVEQQYDVRGSLVTERRHPPDLHTPMTDAC